jgi:hypothetical protein
VATHDLEFLGIGPINTKLVNEMKEQDRNEKFRNAILHKKKSVVREMQLFLFDNGLRTEILFDFKTAMKLKVKSAPEIYVALIEWANHGVFWNVDEHGDIIKNEQGEPTLVDQNGTNIGDQLLIRLYTLLDGSKHQDTKLPSNLY